MEINSDVKERQKERPDVSAEERASIALLKRIRKLRWMGMEGAGLPGDKQRIARAQCYSRRGKCSAKREWKIMPRRMKGRPR